MLKITAFEGDLEISIPIPSYQKLFGYVHACDQEISGFADVEFIDGKFVVGDVYLLEQKVGPAETEMDEEAISTFMEAFLATGKTQLPRLWWHSHVNMGTFWSGTDTGTIDSLTNDSFWVAIVANKREEMRALVKVNGAIPFQLDEVPVHVNYSTVPSAEIVAEVAEKVTKEKPSFGFGGGGYHYGGYQRDEQIEREWGGNGTRTDEWEKDGRPFWTLSRKERKRLKKKQEKAARMGVPMKISDFVQTKVTVPGGNGYPKTYSTRGLPVLTASSSGSEGKILKKKEGGE